MKIGKAVQDALDGKSDDNSINAEFPVLPVEYIEVRPNLIYSLCAEKRVIHLGCTDHLQRIDDRIDNSIYIHRQLSYVAAECIGVDINQEAVAHVHTRGIENVITADMTKPGINAISDSHWDWLLIPDVIEHIPNPAQFLNAIDCTYGRYIDHVLITAPNVFGVLSNNLNQFRREIINYDHCFWFTPYTLCKVVHAAGLDIDEIFMCSYENPSNVIRANSQRLKQYPLLLNTIALTAHSKAKAS